MKVTTEDNGKTDVIEGAIFLIVTTKHPTERNRVNMTKRFAAAATTEAKQRGVIAALADLLQMPGDGIESAIRSLMAGGYRTGEE